MKYLVYANYAGFDLDDPEAMSTNSWTVGLYDNEKDILSATDQEIKDYIDDELDCRFDLDSTDPEELEDFKNRFEVSVYSIRDDKLNEASLVGELWLDSEYYFESLKVYAVKLED